MECLDNTTSKLYTEAYHPSFNEEIGVCSGFDAIPGSVTICDAKGVNDKGLCNCVAEGLLILMFILGFQLNERGVLLFWDF